MPIDDTTSCEYFLKRIVMRDAHDEDVDDAEAALKALKEFATELGGMMKDLADRIADLEEEIYMLHIMDDRDD